MLTKMGDAGGCEEHQLLLLAEQRAIAPEVLVQMFVASPQTRLIFNGVRMTVSWQSIAPELLVQMFGH